MEALREKHAIYIVGSGRINVAGITPDNCDRLCEAIAAVVKGNNAWPFAALSIARYFRSWPHAAHVALLQSIARMSFQGTLLGILAHPLGYGTRTETSNILTSTT